MITVDEMTFENIRDYELMMDLNLSDWEIENRIAGWIKIDDSDYEVYL